MAHCLAQHPLVALPHNKEGHVFDAPQFDDRSTVEDINGRFADLLDSPFSGQLAGDATPIYCLHEQLVSRIARYNPKMKWIMLLRHPVDRAISQFHMERNRGDESWPLLPALLLERWRLRNHNDDFAASSPLRRHSYRLRGDYARQIDTLRKYFPASQLLLLRSADFLVDSAQVLTDVYAFLDLPGPLRLPDETRIFTGDYRSRSRHDLVWRMTNHLMRKERRTLAERYGIEFE